MFAYDAGNPNLTVLYVHRCVYVCVITEGCRDELWICVMSSLWEMCVIPACQEIEWVDGILIRAGAKIERQIYGFYIRPWTERDVPYHRHRQTPCTLDSVRISQVRTTQTRMCGDSTHLSSADNSHWALQDWTLSLYFCPMSPSCRCQRVWALGNMLSPDPSVREKLW